MYTPQKGPPIIYNWANASYPLLLIRLIAANYSLRPLAKHLSREELTALAWAAMEACGRRYQMCLMFSRTEALYIFPDGRSLFTDEVPHGGLNPPFYPPELDFLPGPVWYAWIEPGEAKEEAREKEPGVQDCGNG